MESSLNDDHLVRQEIVAQREVETQTFWRRLIAWSGPVLALAGVAAVSLGGLASASAFRLYSEKRGAEGFDAVLLAALCWCATIVCGIASIIAASTAAFKVHRPGWLPAQFLTITVSVVVVLAALFFLGAGIFFWLLSGMKFGAH
jgi:hypothetical protein